MRIVQQLDTTIWRSYVDQNPLGNIFHTPEMYQVFAHTKGYSPALWAALDDHGEPLSLVQPVTITLMKGPMRLLSSRAIAYGSVLCTPNAMGHEALARLLQRYKQAVGMSLLFTELRNLADMTTIQPVLDECGFVYEDHLNYLIDLQQPQDVVWQKISGNTRNYIRRGLKRNEMSVRQVDTPELLRDSYEVLRKTYDNARIPLADYSLFQAIYEVLCPKQMARITSVYFDTIPIATSVELLYKGVIYAWYGGMDRDYRSHRPSEVLRWHVIEWGINNGYHTFDFGGAGRPDEEYSVRDFKAKFGGELVSLGRSACVHSPHLLNLSKRGYELYRRFMIKPADSASAGRTN